MNRLERISAILVKLQSRPVVTAGEIAEQFGVSLRTVYRDIRSLEESGIPICGESGYGYSLADGFKVSPLMFTTEEALSFLMAEKLISHQTDGDTYGVFRSGMDKIRAVLKSSEKNILHTFDKYMRISDNHHTPPPVPANVLQPLLKSLLNSTQITIEYRAGYNFQITCRTVEPQGIFFMSGNWYILAWCMLRSDYRTFHLGRVIKVIPSDQPFHKVHKPLKQLMEEIYYNETETTVILRTHRDAARDMETMKYNYGLYEETPEQNEEYLIQKYETYSLEKFGRWYLMFADKAEILEPTELKTVIKELIANIKV